MAARAKKTPLGADPDPTDLGTFEGADVLMSTIAVKNAGDGLSKAMVVERRKFHKGERVYVVLECEVTDVAFKPVKDTDGVNRAHSFAAQAATVVDKSLVAEHMEAQKVRIEEAAGISRLPGMDGPSVVNDPEADPLGVFNGDGDASE